MESATSATCELDVCLAKCTNPLSEVSDDLIAQLCQLSSELPNGPFTTLRFLAYKAQSPQECEAIHALQILERVVKTGGFRIADEVGKFRFLNEIIKIVSPKYLAHRTSVRVRQRIVELIFIWSMEFKELPKIFEAYQMLKVQKIVTEDPVHVLENFRPPTPPEPRPKDEIFDNENTVQTLKTLLDSGRPDQLQTANRLIKNLAMKAESRMQFRATFNTELESIQNCAQLLFDMLAQCNLNLRIDPIQKLILDKGSSDEEFQLMRELFANCEKSRMKLFKFANQINSTNKDDTQESDDLNRLLSVAELLTSAINSCKRYFALLNNPRLAAISTAIIVPTSINNNNSGGGDLSSIADASTAVNSEERLLDLNSVLPPITGLDLDPSNSIPDPKEVTSDSGNGTNDQVIDLMMMIGNHQSDTNSTNGLVSDVTATNEPAKFKSAVDELNALSDMMIKQHLSQSSESNGTVSTSNASSTNTQTTRCLSLNQLQQQQQLWQKFAHTGHDSDGPSQEDQPDSTTTTTSSSPSPLNLSELLSNCFVSYDSIVPCTSTERQIPLLLFNENGLMITLHFTGNRPHPQILVLLLTFSNYNPVPVSKIQFLAAVPKNMKVKLQPQTGTSLPGLSTKSSPTGTNLPSIFITQLLLVAFNEPNPGACLLPDQTVSSVCSFSSQYTSLSSSQSSLSSSPDLAASTTTTTTDSSSQNNGYSNQNFSNKKFRLKFKFSYLLNNDIPYEHVSYFDCNLF